MKVTEKDVLYVAELANLELTDSERALMVRDLNHILEHMDRLNQVDTSGVEPMAQVLPGGSPAAMREDEVRPSLPRELVMRNAPETDGAFFKVPKVIEK